jgi:hypothetical protein
MLSTSRPALRAISLTRSTMKAFAGAFGEQSAISVPHQFVETEYSLRFSGPLDYESARYIGLISCRPSLVVMVIFGPRLKITPWASSVACCGPGTLVFSLLWIGCLIGFPLLPTSVNSDLLKLLPGATLLHSPRVQSILPGVAGIILFQSVFVAGLAAGFSVSSSTGFLID